MLPFKDTCRHLCTYACVCNNAYVSDFSQQTAAASLLCLAVGHSGYYPLLFFHFLSMTDMHEDGFEVLINNCEMIKLSCVPFFFFFPNGNAIT